MIVEKRFNRSQVAKILGCHPSTLDRNVGKGNFPLPERHLGRPLWRESVIAGYLESRKNKQGDSNE